MDERILIVEDEPKLAQVVGEYLNQLGLHTHWLDNGTQVIPWVREHQPNLMILDLMLPGRDGLDIFRELRTFSDIPVIMATARIDEIDRLIGLELGADDYVCKPYSPRELTVRVKNLLRRMTRPLHEQASDSGIQINAECMEASFNGQKLDLTPVEFRLLEYLFNHPARVYSRAQLMDRLYDDHRIVTDRAIDSHVKNLRRKLQSIEPECDMIKSIYGVGYKLEF
ncbi:response regulator [Thiothrix lacustris]|uniref:response regulator n=1 Tax=Thiothrix lacustris TaxID=525917 RepID=UPI0027E544A4|nr:response regulator [Thiothrix lacustris]WMP18471.1 response regulator [Thiothrix lacustris]